MVGTNTAAESDKQAASETADVATRIGGLSVLKGLVLYGATLAFAGLYAYFMEQIWSTSQGTAKFDAAMVGAAAALAGVLGSAFALVIGVPTDATNAGLAKDNAKVKDPKGRWQKDAKPKDLARFVLRRLLSLEPGDTHWASWPMTFGIWMYAAVASSVSITYLLNQSETPKDIKALAIAFGGYVITFVTAAYGTAAKKSR
jgi:hypothetical protein